MIVRSLKPLPRIQRKTIALVKARLLNRGLCFYPHKPLPIPRLHIKRFPIRIQFSYRNFPLRSLYKCLICNAFSGPISREDNHGLMRQLEKDVAHVRGLKVEQPVPKGGHTV